MSKTQSQDKSVLQEFLSDLARISLIVAAILAITFTLFVVSCHKQEEPEPVKTSQKSSDESVVKKYGN